MRLSAKPVNPIIVDIVKSPLGKIQQIHAGLMFNPNDICYNDYYEILDILNKTGYK
jgi:hypothetical protein